MQMDIRLLFTGQMTNAVITTRPAAVQQPAGEWLPNGRLVYVSPSIHWYINFFFQQSVDDRIPSNHDPEIQATRNTSYLTASKSLNGRKIARMAPILTIFGPNRSQRRNLFFEKFSNERRRHRGIVVVVIVAVVVAVVGGFSVACIKGTSLL